MSKPNLKVAFCQLDAKGDHYTNYKPAGFYDKMTDEHFSELTQEQERLLIHLNREYLTRLAALQRELEQKYEALLKGLTSATPAVEEPYGYALDKATYSITKREAEAIFPGREAAYYT